MLKAHGTIINLTEDSDEERERTFMVFKRLDIARGWKKMQLAHYETIDCIGDTLTDEDSGEEYTIGEGLEFCDPMNFGTGIWSVFYCHDESGVRTKVIIEWEDSETVRFVYVYQGRVELPVLFDYWDGQESLFTILS